MKAQSAGGPSFLRAAVRRQQRRPGPHGRPGQSGQPAEYRAELTNSGNQPSQPWPFFAIVPLYPGRVRGDGAGAKRALTLPDKTALAIFAAATRRGGFGICAINTRDRQCRSVSRAQLALSFAPARAGYCCSLAALHSHPRLQWSAERDRRRRHAHHLAPSHPPQGRHHHHLQAQRPLRRRGAEEDQYGAA